MVLVQGADFSPSPSPSPSLHPALARSLAHQQSKKKNDQVCPLLLLRSVDVTFAEPSDPRSLALAVLLCLSLSHPSSFPLLQDTTAVHTHMLALGSKVNHPRRLLGDRLL